MTIYDFKPRYQIYADKSGLLVFSVGNLYFFNVFKNWRSYAIGMGSKQKNFKQLYHKM